MPSRKVSQLRPIAEYPYSAHHAEPQRILAVPNRRASLQCPTAEHPCSAQKQSLPALPTQPQNILAVLSRRMPLQCRKSLQNILPRPSCRISLQRANADYHCSAQPLSIPVAPQSLPCPTPESYSQLLNPRTSIPHSPKACLERPTEECPCSARPRTILAMPKILQRFPAVCNSRKPSNYPHGSSRNVQLSCLQVIDDAGKLQK